MIAHIIIHAAGVCNYFIFPLFKLPHCRPEHAHHAYIFYYIVQFAVLSLFKLCTMLYKHVLTRSLRRCQLQSNISNCMVGFSCHNDFKFRVHEIKRVFFLFGLYQVPTRFLPGVPTGDACLVFRPLFLSMLTDKDPRWEPVDRYLL